MSRRMPAGAGLVLALIGLAIASTCGAPSSTHDVEPSDPNDGNAAPPQVVVVKPTMQLSVATPVYLPPQNNPLRNPGFEDTTLQSWDAHGRVEATAKAALDGVAGVRLTAQTDAPELEQNVTVAPGATLRFKARLAKGAALKVTVYPNAASRAFATQAIIPATSNAAAIAVYSLPAVPRDSVPEGVTATAALVQFSLNTASDPSDPRAAVAAPGSYVDLDSIALYAPP